MADSFVEIFSLLPVDAKENLHLLFAKTINHAHALPHDLDAYALYCIDPACVDINHFISLIGREIPVDSLLTVYRKKHSSWISEEVNTTSIPTENGESFYILFHPIPEARSLLYFKEIIAHLRSSEGCPWDREQTHQTLRNNLLEETYEVLEALDKNDDPLMREEFGDLLLQIMLHAQIACERNAFNIYQIIYSISEKLINRHPHVFGSQPTENVSQVLKNWESIKKKERIKKNGGVAKSMLASIPKNLPALNTAQQYQTRAARVGFDWPTIEPVWDKVAEEIAEIKNAVSDQERAHELGDLLFALVNVIRWLGLDAESVLREMNHRFYQRFNFIEEKISAQGRVLSEVSLAEMDRLWEESKNQERD